MQGDVESVAEPRKKTALITGILGQDGSYLGELLIRMNYRVIGTSHRADSVTEVSLAGTDVPVHPLDISNEGQIRAIFERFQPDEIYNLASRSSSSQLFDDPVATADINGLAIVRMLEAIKNICPNTRFCQASSSEVFAKAGQSPQDETTPLRPRNAYGAAKIFAQNMVEAYRERYGLFACSAILYNHESPRRGQEYVTRKVASTAVRIAAGLTKTLTTGNLDSRRDWGFAGDYVRAMWLMLQQDTPDDYVIATGETHSVRELCQLAFSRVGLDYRDYVAVDESLARGQEQTVLCGNSSKAIVQLGWKPSISFVELVNMMVDAEKVKLAGEMTPSYK